MPSIYFFLQSSDSEKTESQTKKSPSPNQPNLPAFFLSTLFRYYKAISKAIFQGGNQRRTSSILLGSACASHSKSQQRPQPCPLSSASCLGNSLFPNYPLVGYCWRGITCACSKVPAWGLMQPLPGKHGKRCVQWCQQCRDRTSLGLCFETGTRSCACNTLSSSKLGLVE